MEKRGVMNLVREVLWAFSKDARIADLRGQLDRFYAEVEGKVSVDMHVMADLDRSVGGQFFRADEVVRKAAELVREHRLNTTGLWAVHVDGPDEVFPVESRDDAIAQAAVFNSRAGYRDLDVQARAVPWALGKRAHEAGLKLSLLSGDEDTVPMSYGGAD